MALTVKTLNAKLAFLPITLCSLTLSFTLFANVGDKCPIDQVLITKFKEQRGALDSLLMMLKKDNGMVSYVGKGIVTADLVTVSPERKREYLAVIDELGEAVLTHNQGETTIWFWLDAASIASHSRSKGIAFLPDIGKYRYEVLTELTGLEKLNREGVFLRSLGDNWYLIYLESN